MKGPSPKPSRGLWSYPKTIAGVYEHNTSVCIGCCRIRIYQMEKRVEHKMEAGGFRYMYRDKGLRNNKLYKPNCNCYL